MKDECADKKNNLPEVEQLGAWLEENTHLDREDKNIIAYIWPGASEVALVLSSYFNADKVLEVSPNATPTRDEEIAAVNAKHYELPEIIKEENEDFLGAPEIEYGWALGSALTELADPEPEELSVEEQIRAVEDLTNISKEVMGNEGTVIYNTTGLEKSYYNPLASEDSPDLQEYAELLSSEMVKNGFSEVRVYEETPVFNSPHIVGTLEKTQ